MRLVASLSPCFFRKFDCSLHLLALCFFCLFSLVSFFLLLSSVHVLGSCIQQRDLLPASPLLFALVSVSSPFHSSQMPFAFHVSCMLLPHSLSCPLPLPSLFLLPFFVAPPPSLSFSYAHLPVPLGACSRARAWPGVTRGAGPLSPLCYAPRFVLILFHLSPFYSLKNEEVECGIKWSTGRMWFVFNVFFPHF